MRYVVLADVHAGTANTQLNGQNYTFAIEVLRQAVPRVLAERPDRVVVAGDLVNVGAEEEFALVRPVLEPLGDRLRIIPGNHDCIRCSSSAFGQGLAGVVLNGREAQADHVTLYLNSAVDEQRPGHWWGTLSADALRGPRRLAGLDLAAADLRSSSARGHCAHAG